ncbi:GNAT family N-acetyltransferase [Pontiella sp.]|uniref:GNAT family N-acetyltransferase n=1 Tax=Pontiella sp. TaxID=2837462 RepID=UPI0035636B4E
METNACAGVVCRRVGVNRIDDLLALEEACFECDRISRRNLRNLLRSPSACCLGVFLGKELVGSMVVLFRRNTRSARIYSVAVASAQRGRGIARRLMARAEREARGRGCTRMRLEVRLDNFPAIKLYESLGFASARIIPEFYEDGTHAMVYRKELES